MKKFLCSFIIGLITIFTLNSCVSSAYAQDDIYSDGVTYTTIVTYGTPYYVDGVISYYLYRNIYYYPYVWEGVRYFHPFRTCQPRGYIFRPSGPHFRPHHYLGYHHVQRPIINHRYTPNRPVQSRPNTVTPQRHDPVRSSTRETVRRSIPQRSTPIRGNQGVQRRGNFGGRR